MLTAKNSHPYSTFPVFSIDIVRYRSGDYREPPENVLVIAKLFPTAFVHAYSWSIHKPSISYGRQQSYTGRAA